MPRLAERDYTYFTTVRGLCGSCGAVAPARVVFRDGAVWQESLCVSCRAEPVRIAGDVAWYLRETLRPLPDASPLAGARAQACGCPDDCGPCAWHASPCRTPAIPLGRNGRSASEDDVTRILDRIIESAGPVDLVEFTGDAKRHPDLGALSRACDRPDVGRACVRVDDLRRLADPAFVGRLRDDGLHVAPVIDTRHEGATAEGAALVRRLVDTGVDVAPRVSLAPGVGGIEEIIDLVRGDGGVDVLRIETELPVDEAARIVCGGSNGDVTFDDFHARPGSHPLCYLSCHALALDDGLVSLARVAPAERVAGLCAESFLVRPEGALELLRVAINELHARGERDRLQPLRRLVERLFPSGEAPALFERQRITYATLRTIHIHAMAHPGSIDCSRAATCQDQIALSDGRLVPACLHAARTGDTEQERPC